MKHRLIAAITLFILLAPVAQAQERISIIPAVIADDSTDDAITAVKVEAGIALALDLTGRFEYIPSAVRDSLIAQQTSNQVSTMEAVVIAEAKAAVFAKCIRVGNIVRAEVSLLSGKDLATAQRGVGYAAIRHRNEAGVVADPAILASLQRALCAALQDSALYAESPEDLRVIPTSLVSIGGIEFVLDSSIAPSWSLFEDRTVVSYDLAINLVHELQSRNHLTIVDLDTRDSMFAMGGLLLVENDRPVSNTELRILSLFDVGYVITGSFARDQYGALLRLHWCTVEPDGRYTVVRSAERRVKEDSAVQLRTALMSYSQEIVGKHK